MTQHNHTKQWRRALNLQTAQPVNPLWQRTTLRNPIREVRSAANPIKMKWLRVRVNSASSPAVVCKQYLQSNYSENLCSNQMTNKTIFSALVKLCRAIVVFPLLEIQKQEVPSWTVVRAADKSATIYSCLNPAKPTCSIDWPVKIRDAGLCPVPARLQHSQGKT